MCYGIVLASYEGWEITSEQCTLYKVCILVQYVTVGATTSILSLYMQCGGGEGSPWLVVSAVYFFGKIFYRHWYKVPTGTCYPYKGGGL